MDRIARSVFTCAVIFVGIVLVWTPAAYVLGERGTLFAAFGVSAVAALALVALLARAGYARPAAALLIGTMFMSASIGLWVDGGLGGTSTATFVAVVVAAGLFFSSRVSWATAAAALLVLGGAWALEVRGMLPEPSPYAPGPEFISMAMTISITLALVQLNFGRIRESRNFLRAVADATPHALYVYDLAEGRNAYGNSPSIDQLGYETSPANDMGMLFDIVHPDDTRALIEHAKRVMMAPDDEVLEIEYRLRHADGSYRMIRDRSRIFDRSPDGSVRQIVGAAEDVTAQREATRALESSRERLRRGERLEALGRLAGGIAHDFNNYLTVIIGATEVAATDPSASDSLRELIQDAHAAARRSAELTRQLLGFSQQRLMRPSYFELNDLLRESDRLLRRVIPEHIQVEVLPGAASSKIHADRGQIEQVVMNLAVNARDAMPEGGSLTIASTHASIGDAQAAGREDAQPGEYVVLQVSDTGTGMDEATRAKIFEPLFTTKEAGSGTGFGLATVEAVVGHCGGFVEVETELGSGTRFSVYLPRAEGTEDERASEMEPNGRGGSERILLVEDDEYVRSFTRRALEGAGYRVTAASDGAAAVDLFQRSPDAFDLLLTDVMLPNLSGLDVASELRRQRPEIRVVYMSGYTASDLADQGLRPKDHLLDKPFSPEELGRKIRRALEEG